VPVGELDALAASGPATFHGCEVKYVPANIAELIEALPLLESVDRIDYDDDARIGEGFSFEPVDELMTVRAHVGPAFESDQAKEIPEEKGGGCGARGGRRYATPGLSARSIV
jgi:hypothetical protein